MRTVFADSLYWIARANPKDQWHQQAIAAEESVREAHIVTTENVIVEFLTYFGAYGSEARRMASRVTRGILGNAEVEVVPHTSKTFTDGLTLYEARSDKTYSMVDCMSMQVMRRRDSTEVLTHDHHFAQEGFTILL